MTKGAKPTPRGNDRIRVPYWDELRVISPPHHLPCRAGWRLFVQRLDVDAKHGGRPPVLRYAISPTDFQNELIARGLRLYYPSYDHGWIRIEKDPDPTRRLREM